MTLHCGQFPFPGKIAIAVCLLVFAATRPYRMLVFANAEGIYAKGIVSAPSALAVVGTILAAIAEEK